MRTLLINTIFFVNVFFTAANCNTHEHIPVVKLNESKMISSSELNLLIDTNDLMAQIELRGYHRDGKIEFLWTHQGNGEACEYVLQRSADNKNFHDISIQRSEGSSIGDVYYEVDSGHRSLNDKKYYRIKVVNKKGAETFSRIIKV